MKIVCAWCGWHGVKEPMDDPSTTHGMCQICFLENLRKMREDMSNEPQKCLTKNCFMLEAPALGKGLCMSCHGRAKKAVAAGATSWDELERLGLARAATTETDPFLASLNEARNASARDNKN